MPRPSGRSQIVIAANREIAEKVEAVRLLLISEEIGQAETANSGRGGAAGEQRDPPIPLRIRQRLEQDGVYDGENGRGAADSSRECNDGKDRKPLIAFPGSPALRDQGEHLLRIIVRNRGSEVREAGFGIRGLEQWF